MALTETYKAVYDGLDSEGMAKVGAFVSSFLQANAEGDGPAKLGLVKEALAKLADDPEHFDRLLGTLEYAEHYGSPAEKVAVAHVLPILLGAMKELDTEAALEKAAEGEGMSPFQKAQLGIGVAGLGLAAAPFAGHVMRRHRQEGRIRNSLHQVMQDHPELRSSPHTSRYFQAIVDFAPDVAANPLVAGNVMKTMHQIGPGSVTPRMIQELLQVQRGVDDRPSSARFLGEAAKPVGGLAKTVGDAGPKPSKKGA